MNRLKNIIALLIIVVFAASCEKEIDNLDKLNGVTAPTNVSAIFDITQDNTGLVSIIPNAEGVTEYLITFGDLVDETPTKYGLNDEITHIYKDGVYNVGITGSGITGLTTTYTAELNVTFRAPDNLVVTVEQDAVNPNKISVSATADYATVMDIKFGDVENEVPVTVLPEEVATHTYTEPGDYILMVEARSGSDSTAIFTDTITIYEASDPVNLPINFETYTVDYAFIDFGNTSCEVVNNPYASGINTSARVAQFTKPMNAEIGAGSYLILENPINFNSSKLFKVKTWSSKLGATVKLKVENIDNGDIAHDVDATNTVTDQWEELEFDFTGIDLSNTYQKVLIFFDYGNVGDDATYYFDDIVLTSSTPSTGIVGTWKMAPEAGSFGVGPGQGDISWWSIDEAGVEARACFFDDAYVFGADGSFSNILGAETWVEGWQGGSDGCALPVAPHNGSAEATYNYDEGAGTVTVFGVGAYLGIPKAFNGGELTNPDEAPESITYILEFTENGTVMILDIQISDEGWWRFKLIKDGGGSTSPYEGSWKMANEAGALGVGATQGDISWWSNTEEDLTIRDCFFNDTYVFGADGSFSNVLDGETWIEEWQGSDPPTCGTPVAPHDGTVAATYSYDAGSVTLNGIGAYLGIPKVFNGGELSDPADAPASITYIVEFSENNSVMTLDIDVSNAWWRFKMVKN